MQNSLKVKYFDDTDGLDPSLVAYMNAKLDTFKHDAEFEIAKLRLDVE